MRALLWKDCRVQGSVLRIGTVLLLMPYLFGLCGGLYVRWQLDVSWWTFKAATGIGSVSLVLSLFTITFLAAGSIAAEREDRSAEFLACLPPSRGTILTSKLVVALGAGLCPWILNLVTIFIVAPRLPGAPSIIDPSVMDDPVEESLTVAAIAVVLFGVAWLFSERVGKPVIAAACGLAAPVAIAAALKGIQSTVDFPTPAFGASFRSACLVLGIAAFAAGTVSYLRRFEP